MFTTFTIPAVAPALGWTVVLGPLAVVAVLAVFGVFGFLVVGAVLQLGGVPPDIDPRPAARSRRGPDAAPPARGACWSCGERLVA